MIRVFFIYWKSDLRFLYDDIIVQLLLLLLNIHLPKTWVNYKKKWIKYMFEFVSKYTILLWLDCFVWFVAEEEISKQ